MEVLDDKLTLNETMNRMKLTNDKHLTIGIMLICMWHLWKRIEKKMSVQNRASRWKMRHCGSETRFDKQIVLIILIINALNTDIIRWYKNEKMRHCERKTRHDQCNK